MNLSGKKIAQDGGEGLWHLDRRDMGGRYHPNLRMRYLLLNLAAMAFEWRGDILGPAHNQRWRLDLCDPVQHRHVANRGAATGVTFSIQRQEMRANGFHLWRMIAPELCREE